MSDGIRVGQRVRAVGHLWWGTVVRAWADGGERLLNALSYEPPEMVDVLWDGAPRIVVEDVKDLVLEEKHV